MQKTERAGLALAEIAGLWRFVSSEGISQARILTLCLCHYVNIGSAVR